MSSDRLSGRAAISPVPASNLAIEGTAKVRTKDSSRPNWTSKAMS